MDTSRYLPSFLTAGQYDGKLYGLAPNVNTLALFYNKTLLKQAGVSVPTTWAELSAAAMKLTKGDTYGLPIRQRAAPRAVGRWPRLSRLRSIVRCAAGPAKPPARRCAAECGVKIVQWAGDDCADGSGPRSPV